MPRKRIQAIVFGPQGSGKGTQGQQLGERFGVPLIGSGDLFREEIEFGGTLGSLTKEYVARGMLAPDELVNAIVQKRLQEIPLERGFLLDGYPRNVEQAASLDRLVKINLAIQLKISDAEAVRRIQGRLQCSRCRSIFHEYDLPPAHPGVCTLCGTQRLTRREDDQEDVLRLRLAAYHFMTEPLASYYRQCGVLLAVHAEQPAGMLFAELTKKIKRLGFSE